jgi:hypothetical protein
MCVFRSGHVQERQVSAAKAESAVIATACVCVCVCVLSECRFSHGPSGEALPLSPTNSVSSGGVAGSPHRDTRGGGNLSVSSAGEPTHSLHPCLCLALIAVVCAVCVYVLAGSSGGDLHLPPPPPVIVQVPPGHPVFCIDVECVATGDCESRCCAGGLA